MKFTALRTVARLLRVLAVLQGVLGLYEASTSASVLVFAVAATGVAWKVLVTYAAAEAIGVFLAIEESTHRTANAMASQRALLGRSAKDEPEDRPGTKRFVTCKSCGERTEADSRFCQRCGKLVAGE
jgi:hypothetical protein